MTRQHKKKQPTPKQPQPQSVDLPPPEPPENNLPPIEPQENSLPLEETIQESEGISSTTSSAYNPFDGAVESVIAAPPENGESGLMSSDEFYQFFKEAFELSGDLSGLDSLRINEADAMEKTGAERTALVIHRSALKYPWLRFIIDKHSGFVQDAMLIAIFTTKKLKAVQAEATEKNIRLPWFKR